MLHIDRLTLLVVVIAFDRFADVALAWALQNGLSNISSHHSLSLGAKSSIAAENNEDGRARYLTMGLIDLLI